MSAETMLELLFRRATTAPDQTAYTFLEGGEVEIARISHLELWTRARGIASHLEALAAASPAREQPRVLLLYPSGIDFISGFFGCLCARVVPAPVDPQHNKRSFARLEGVVRSSAATVALTSSALYPELSRLSSSIAGLKGLRLVATDQVPAGASDSGAMRAVSRDDLALLQYSSGSTGDPKGVMVTHANLLENLAALDEGWSIEDEGCMVTWLPMSHDMGLVFGLLYPLYKGYPCHAMSPAAFMQDPTRWLRAISSRRATHSAAPNFAYDLCVRKSSPEQRAALDLGSWKVALNAAEPVRQETLDAFAQAFAPCGFDPLTFCPGYGLAEATLKVTTIGRAQRPATLRLDRGALEKGRAVAVALPGEEARSCVSCGRPAAGTQVVIVDPDTMARRPPGDVGEILVNGPGVARGYLNQDEETAQTFRVFLRDPEEGPFLRTGDLGFLLSGELFVVGRRKGLIIIRGRNHHASDIEFTVERCHEALRPGCGAAYAIEVDDEERLAIAQEVKREWVKRLAPREIVDVIRGAVATAHGVTPREITLLEPGELPKTTSGKQRRLSCRDALRAGELRVIHRWTGGLVEEESEGEEMALKPEHIESWIACYISSRLLVGPEEIDMQSSLESLGLDSTEVIELFAALERFTGLRIPEDLPGQRLSPSAITQRLLER